MHANAQAWLGRCCEAVPGATRAVVVRRAGRGDAFVVVAHWPEERSASNDLAAIAGQAARRDAAVRRSEPPSDCSPIASSRWTTVCVTIRERLRAACSSLVLPIACVAIRSR